MGSTLPQSVLNGLIEWGVIALIFWVIPIWIIALSVSRCAWELRHIARTLYYGSESERQTHNKTVAQHKGHPPSVATRVVNSMFGR